MDGGRVCEVILRGRGSVPSRWEGVFGKSDFEPDPGERSESDESDRKRGRGPPRAEDAAFLVMEIVDIVVCPNPLRVISTWLLFPKRIE